MGVNRIKQSNGCFERRVPTRHIYKGCVRRPRMAWATVWNSHIIAELLRSANHIQFALVCRELLTAGARLLHTTAPPAPLLHAKEPETGERRGSEEILILTDPHRSSQTAFCMQSLPEALLCKLCSASHTEMPRDNSSVC